METFYRFILDFKDESNSELVDPAYCKLPSFAEKDMFWMTKDRQKIGIPPIETYIIE
jgi:hypothetical protein